MGRLIVSVDGNVYETEHARVLTPAELEDRQAKLQADLNELNQAVSIRAVGNAPTAVAPAPVAPATPVAPAAPVDVTPQFNPQPSVGNDVTPAPAPVASGEAQAQPVDLQVAPQPPVLS
jgi:hypothetical protein